MSFFFLCIKRFQKDCTIWILQENFFLPWTQEDGIRTRFLFIWDQIMHKIFIDLFNTWSDPVTGYYSLFWDHDPRLVTGSGLYRVKHLKAFFYQKFKILDFTNHFTLWVVFLQMDNPYHVLHINNTNTYITWIYLYTIGIRIFHFLKIFKNQHIILKN